MKLNLGVGGDWHSVFGHAAYQGPRHCHHITGRLLTSSFHHYVTCVFARPCLYLGRSAGSLRYCAGFIPIGRIQTGTRLLRPRRACIPYSTLIPLLTRPRIAGHKILSCPSLDEVYIDLPLLIPSLSAIRLCRVIYLDQRAVFTTTLL